MTRRLDALLWRLLAGINPAGLHRHDEDVHLLIRPEWAWDLVADRWQAFQESGDCQSVRLGQVREATPRHRWRQYASIRPLPSRDRRDDLLRRPVSQTGFLVRRQVRADEHALPRNREADIRSTQVARHIGMAKEMAGRMA